MGMTEFILLLMVFGADPPGPVRTPFSDPGSSLLASQPPSPGSAGTFRGQFVPRGLLSGGRDSGTPFYVA